MLLVTYDLKKPGQSYEALYSSIKEFGPWWHYLESTWLLDTSRTPQEVANSLRQHIDQNDNLLVIEVNPQNKQGWLPAKAWDWISEHS